MKIARLRHLVTFERLYTGIDSDGNEEDPVWLPAFGEHSRVHAAVHALSGGEMIRAGAAQSKVTTRIIVRYRPGIIATGMRVRMGEEVFDILAVIPDPVSRNRYITLQVASGVNDG